MNIVLIHRYFWPDTPPYAHILREIAVMLGEMGHDVTVLTCQPSYSPDGSESAPGDEWLHDRVRVRRWPVVNDRRSNAWKLVNLAWFCFRLMAARLGMRGVNVVMAASTPPVLVARVSSWIARSLGASFIYHKQDIYPDVALAPGLLTSRSVAKVAASIDARTDASATRIVVLSRDMAETTAKRGIERSRITIINNFDPWRLPDDDRDVSSPRRMQGPLRVAYAGNLGRFQNLESVIDAIRYLRDDPVIVHFFGEGPLRRQLEAAVSEFGLANIRLHGHRPADEVAAFLRREADLGIVTLAPGVIRAAFPSKTLSYLRQGCPVLAVVEADSELAEMLLAAGAGFQVDPDNPIEMSRRLRQLAADPGALAIASERASALYHDRFAADVQLRRWADLFEQIAADQAA